MDHEITSIQKKISELPEGKLIFVRNGNYTKWFQSDGHKSTYIPRKNQLLAEQLALKKYLSLQMDDLIRKKKTIEYYLRHQNADNNADKLLSADSEYSELLSPLFVPSSQELQDWMNAPYDRNQTHPENLIHKTSSGILVRSKSEALISMFLHMNGIPFRYECALPLEDTTLFPDFTIRHPQNGQIFYWEHFGMMDNPAYCKNTCSKIQIYASNGIYPSIQLLTTYETKEHPLDPAIIEAMIKHYFLT